MLEKHNMLSVNQINAQIKLTEMWKATNDSEHPFKIQKKSVGEDGRCSRSISNGMIKVTAASNLTQRTFINDGIKAWNLAPQGIKEIKLWKKQNLK